MIVVDANLRLYAYDPDAALHDASRRWLEETGTLKFSERCCRTGRRPAALVRSTLLVRAARSRARQWGRS